MDFCSSFLDYLLFRRYVQAHGPKENNKEVRFSACVREMFMHFAQKIRDCISQVPFLCLSYFYSLLFFFPWEKGFKGTETSKCSWKIILSSEMCIQEISE